MIIEESIIRDLVINYIKIRKSKRIRDDAEIKWTNVNDLDPTEQKILKNDILNLIKETDCRIIIYLAPQDFYHKLKLETQNGIKKIKFQMDKNKYLKALQYATNICLQKFNQYLACIGERGLMLADESGSCKKEIQKHCFSLYPEGTSRSALNQIAYVTIPIDSLYSPIHQINDVVMGAIQHSLKEYKNNFLPLIKDRFWSEMRNGQSTIIGYGFNVYPISADTQWMQKMLERVKDKFIRRISS